MPGPISERLLGVRTEGIDGSRPPTRGGSPSADAPRAGGRSDLTQIKARLQRQLSAEVGPDADLTGAQGRRLVEALLNEIIEAEGLPLPRVERSRLLEAVLAEVLSFGP